MLALIQALESPAPELRAPPAGLSNKPLALPEFNALLSAIAQSKHALLASRSVPLLLPHKFALSPAQMEVVMGSFTTTDSAALRSAWCAWLCALWDATHVLAPSAVDTLHAAFGMLFYFLFQYNNNTSAVAVQTNIARLVYRLARSVDVTRMRCLQLSTALQRPDASPALVALGELFLELNPQADIAFPARERGVNGRSGLTAKASLRLHQSMSKPREHAMIRQLLLHGPTTLEENERAGEEEEDDVLREHLVERAHSIKRAKLSLLTTSENEEDENEEEQLAKLLQTWDGVQDLDLVIARLLRSRFPPRKPAQESFMRNILTPLLHLLITGVPLTTHYPICRGVGELLERWIAEEEMCGLFVSHIQTRFDQCFCHLLCLEADATIHLSIYAFFRAVAQGLARRAKVFSPQASPAKPPSELLSRLLLLSNDLLGLANACQLLCDLLPVFRAENLAGAQMDNQSRIQASKYFEEVVQDYCRVLVLGQGKRTFDYANWNGTELGLVGGGGGGEEGGGRLFALRGLWLEWCEERGEERDADMRADEERIARFLLWLKQEKRVPQLATLVGSVSTRFHRLL